MGRVDGKIALVTGAARGQGRSHAVRLAEEGADIIALDVAAEIETAPYDSATPEELAETARQVEALDRRVVTVQADVRDFDSMRKSVDSMVGELGGLDIVAANAGIVSYGRVEELSDRTWQDAIDINLTGVWRTVKSALPHLRATGDGGSIVITSSRAGIKALPNMSHYVSAKHGVIGLMRAMAIEFAPDSIRVNAVLPGFVATPMTMNDALFRNFRPDLENPTLEDAREGATGMSLLPIPWLEPEDIANAVLFLASDEARYITGITLSVDGGTP